MPGSVPPAHPTGCPPWDASRKAAPPRPGQPGKRKNQHPWERSSQRPRTKRAAMTTPSSRQQATSDSADALGAPRYEYRYPASAKVLVFGLLLLIPLSTAAFLSQAIRPGALSDRVVPGL